MSPHESYNEYNHGRADSFTCVLNQCQVTNGGVNTYSYHSQAKFKVRQDPTVTHRADL